MIHGHFPEDNSHPLLRQEKIGFLQVRRVARYASDLLQPRMHGDKIVVRSLRDVPVHGVAKVLE